MLSLAFVFAVETGMIATAVAFTCVVTTGGVKIERMSTPWVPVIAA